MQSFNWVDIDGIRYSWDGQGSITCTGQFGYQATMAGDRIDGLDLESEDGDVAGSLNVDFAAATIAFNPAMDAEPPHRVVLVAAEFEPCLLAGSAHSLRQYRLCSTDHIHAGRPY